MGTKSTIAGMEHTKADNNGQESTEKPEGNRHCTKVFRHIWSGIGQVYPASGGLTGVGQAHIESRSLSGVRHLDAGGAIAPLGHPSAPAKALQSRVSKIRPAVP